MGLRGRPGICCGGSGAPGSRLCLRHASTSAPVGDSSQRICDVGVAVSELRQPHVRGLRKQVVTTVGQICGSECAEVPHAAKTTSLLVDELWARGDALFIAPTWASTSSSRRGRSPAQNSAGTVRYRSLATRSRCRDAMPAETNTHPLRMASAFGRLAAPESGPTRARAPSRPSYRRLSSTACDAPRDIAPPPGTRSLDEIAERSNRSH